LRSKISKTKTRSKIQKKNKFNAKIKIAYEKDRRKEGYQQITCG